MAKVQLRNRPKRSSEVLARYPTEHENSILYRSLRCCEWSYLEPHFSAPKATGRPRLHHTREILHAIFFYILKKSGCAWRLLPHDLEHRGRPSTTTTSGLGA